MPAKTVTVRIKRQERPGAASFWQEFEVPVEPAMNVIALLQAIRRIGKTSTGDRADAVAWESNCLEEVCGACTMVIGGKVRQACSALVERLGNPITIEPMTKFPVVRDLVVDRSSMFENLKKVKAWIHLDGTARAGDVFLGAGFVEGGLADGPVRYAEWRVWGLGR